MNKFIALVSMAVLGLLAGCAGGGNSASSSAASPGGGSGVTVFGTIDTSVTGTRNQSR